MSTRVRWASRIAPPGQVNALAAAEAAARAAGRDLRDLTTSNPTAVGLPYPADEIAAALADPRVAGYVPEPFGDELARAAVADECAAAGHPVSVDRVVLTASSSESYSFLFRLLADPGDVVLIPAPSYPLFEYLAALDGVAARPYRVWCDGDGWHLDRDSIDLDGARAVVVVNPNNPTGSMLTTDELVWLTDACAARGIAIISDEVFADYVTAPRPDAVTSVLGRSGTALSFALGGLSKGSGLPQLKLGWIAIDGPDALVGEALRRLELIADTTLSVGTPVQLALPALLRLGRSIRTAIAARVRRNHLHLQTALRGTSLTLLPREAGWSAIARLPAVMSDEAWALSLLEVGVLVQPGYFFDLEQGASIVLSLLPAPDVFDDGIARMVAAVQSRSSP